MTRKRGARPRGGGQCSRPAPRAGSDLPLRTKILYASSSLGSEALTQSRGLWLIYYYAPPEDADLERQLPRLLIGVLLVVGRLLESFDDALIGYWSDRTRSRWGRRIPFIVGATPLWALFAFLLFVPPDAGTVGTAIYFFVALELFFLFATLSGGPYEALLPEIAPRNEDRVKVAGIRVYFGAAGAGIGLVASGLLVDTIGFAGMAVALAALALTARYLGLAGAWERAKRSRTPAEISFREAMRATFSNRAFLLFLPTFVLFQIGFQILVGVLPFYVNAVLRIEDEGMWVAVLTAVALSSMLAALPLFGRLALRTSKRHAYRTALLASAVLFPVAAIPGLVPGVPAEAELIAAMVIVGAPIAGNYLFPAVLTADIIDDDSARTGLRREATFYGAQNFVEKTATSLAPLILVLLLLFGDTADDPLGIRLVGPVAGVIAAMGYLIFRRYELPDQVPARVIPVTPA
jgi:GPH family glycoside/pentoside/hexuronide:cation symporter